MSLFADNQTVFRAEQRVAFTALNRNAHTTIIALDGLHAALSEGRWYEQETLRLGYPPLYSKYTVGEAEYRRAERAKAR